MVLLFVGIVVVVVLAVADVVVLVVALQLSAALLWPFLPSVQGSTLQSLQSEGLGSWHILGFQVFVGTDRLGGLSRGTRNTWC